MKKKTKKLSTRDYSKKIYFTPDKKDLRKSFPKSFMVIWSIICFAGGIFLFNFSGLLAGICFALGFVFLSYLWGGSIWK
tara:strand:+ start:444 stop:680 length:237 start_codon:yes stop_codon:yes gene_type:complete